MATAIKVERLRRPQSLAALVTDQIRNMIIADELALGEQLSEAVLAEQLGVSRTPVREAFQRLEAERLVDIQPQRGTFVFTYTLDELREICELREVLETGALRMALSRDSAGLGRILRDRLDAAEAALAKGPAGVQPFDSAFHEGLVRASENHELIDAYLRVSGRVRAIRFRLTRTADRIASAQMDHRKITELVLAGGHAEAERRLGRHVHNGYRVFLATVTGGASET